jgi:hypothetical protein
VVYVGRTHSGCEVRKGAAGRHIYSGCEASKRVCRLLGMRLTLNQRKKTDLWDFGLLRQE